MKTKSHLILQSYCEALLLNQTITFPNGTKEKVAKIEVNSDKSLPETNYTMNIWSINNNGVTKMIFEAKLDDIESIISKSKLGNLNE